MSPLLTILSCGSSAASDQALQKFGQFLGLQTKLVTVNGEFAEAPETLWSTTANGCVLALDCSAIRVLGHMKWFARLLEETRFVFVYGFTPGDGESQELNWLTGGIFSAVAPEGAGPRQFKVHSDVKYGAFPVSGMSYSIESGPVAAFVCSMPTEGIETYLSVNCRPYFVSFLRNGTEFFLLSEETLVDVDTILARNASLRPWYAQLVAMAIFLRTAFGQSCWSAPVTGATFILDDPYLKKRYGFVRYETLLPELQRINCALTVAFIPYNYRRSNPRTIDLLRHNDERFSIAVHGCNHTGGEFASLDEMWLTGTATCALERMESHARRTKMPFDDVMIFPQGYFSTKAVKALKECGYVAAVNSSPWPVDFQECPLTIRDLLDVAVTRYNSFPLFVRRYPLNIFDFAFDALFQKPLLVVEHHGYFRTGYGPLASFVRQIKNVNAKFTWMPLRKTLTSSCVMRQIAGTQYEVKFFTPIFKFRNPIAERCSFSLLKPETSDLVTGVFWGGNRVPFEIYSGYLHCEVQLDPGEEQQLKIVYRSVKRTHYSPSLKYRCGVVVRRLLSDMRDNYLSRNKLLLSAAEKTKNQLRNNS